MRRNRLLPALAGIFFLSSTVSAASLTPEARERVRRALYELRENPVAVAIPLDRVVRGYGLVLEKLVTGESTETGYWLRAAKDRVRLANSVGTFLLQLDRRITPAPPLVVRTRLRRVAARLEALTAGGSGDLSYWRSMALELGEILLAQGAELHALVDLILAEAPDRVVPAHLSLYYLGSSLVTAAPSGKGSMDYWRRCAEDQVGLTRSMGLAVAGYVRSMQQPVRRLLLEEAAALRGVRLGQADDLDSWYQEAHRLEAVLASHQAVLHLIGDELRKISEGR